MDSEALVEREAAAFQAAVGAVMRMLASRGQITPTLIALRRREEQLGEAWRMDVSNAMKDPATGRQEIFWLIEHLFDERRTDFTAVGLPADVERPDAVLLLLEGFGTFGPDSERFRVVAVELVTKAGERGASLYRIDVSNPGEPRLQHLGVGGEHGDRTRRTLH